MTVSLRSRLANNGDVKLHYWVAGSGPPIVLLHGFPDHALGWRRQIEALAPHFSVIAPDLRGFGKSDAPPGVAHYALSHLVNDVLAVLSEEGIRQAAIIGHDWGGTIAWWLAIRAPRVVRHLVVLSTPHPRPYLRAIADPANAEIVRYIRRFQKAGAAGALDLDELSSWVVSREDRHALRQALGSSSAEAMLNYYKANVPLGHVPDMGPQPLIKAPTMIMFGTADPYVPVAAYDGAFREVENVTVLVAIPGVGHFIHHEAADFVTDKIEEWLARPPSAYRQRSLQTSD